MSPGETSPVRTSRSGRISFAGEMSLQLGAAQATSFADRLARRYQATPGDRDAHGQRALPLRPLPADDRCRAEPRVKVLAKRETPSARTERDDALDACAKLRQTVAASLARYEPERLGVYTSRRATLLLDSGVPGASPQRRMAALCLCRGRRSREVLATSRALFGSETIEYRTADPDAIRRRARDQGISHADRGRHVRRACCRRLFRSC